MDEVTMVREVLPPPPPPSKQVTAQARQRLAARIEASGPQPGQPGRSRPGRRRGQPPRVRWAVSLLGIASAGLAGALTVAMLVPSGTQPALRHRQHGGQPRLVTTEELPGGVLAGQPAQPFLVALAARVAQARPATGRYWCQSVISGQLKPFGPGGQELTPAMPGQVASPVSDYRYSIFVRQLQYDCFEYSGTVSRNAGGFFQNLGGVPATPKDAAAWHRDGSPAWHGWYGNRQLIHSQPGPRRWGTGKPGQSPWHPLPADPVKLRKVLLAGMKHDPNVTIPEQQPGASDARILAENLYEQTRILLLEPLPAAVRAAAYQVMATIPGVHMRPGITDASGRPGTALWYGPRRDPSQIVVVDPVTGMLLADEWFAPRPDGVYATGTLLAYNLWQTPGWTSRPPVPGK